MPLVAAILVEGRSDERAVQAAAALLGHDLQAAGVGVIAIGGAMAMRRAVAEHGPAGAGLRLSGLVDVGEVRHACRALFDGADTEPYPGALAASGFFVCVRDLEAELIRALGSAGVEAVLAEHGDLDRFHMFQRQPAHREEPVADQLHRFLGTVAGRRIAYGGHLVDALDPARLPAPLREVLTFAMTPDRPDFEIEFRWKEQVYYWEGSRGLYLDGGWGVTPIVTYVPPAESWDSVAPEWAKGRREEIVRRLTEQPNHRVVEGDYRANLGVTR